MCSATAVTFSRASAKASAREAGEPRADGVRRASSRARVACNQSGGRGCCSATRTGGAVGRWAKSAVESNAESDGCGVEVRTMASQSRDATSERRGACTAAMCAAKDPIATARRSPRAAGKEMTSLGTYAGGRRGREVFELCVSAAARHRPCHGHQFLSSILQNTVGNDALQKELYALRMTHGKGFVSDVSIG